MITATTPRLINLRTVLPQRTLQFPSPATQSWKPAQSGRRLLRIALRYGYLTRDLAALAYTHAHPRGVGASHVRDELTDLVRNGYLHRFYRPVDPRSGSRQYVYAASVKAAHLFDDEHHWTRSTLKQISNRANPHRDYDHQLGLALLRILWDAGSVPYTDPAQPETYRFQTVAYWDHPHTFSVRVASKRAQVRPDTTILLYRHYEAENRRHHRRIHVELERTRKNLKRTDWRFLLYRELLADPQGQVARAIKAQAGVAPEQASALFIAADHEHMLQLLSSAETALNLERLKRQRRTKELPDLWFTSLDQIVRSDLQIDPRTGKEHLVETIIEPAALFTRPLCRNLLGQQGTILDLRA